LDGPSFFSAVSVVRRKYAARNVLFTVAALVMVFIGCEKERSEFVLVTLKTGVIELKIDTPADAVPNNPVFVATFNYEVDYTTVVPENITLMQGYDNALIPLNVVARENTVTVTPTELLSTGAVYTLTLAGLIKSAGGQALAASSWSFTTSGSFAPRGAIAYWNFEDNADDKAGSYDATSKGIVAITYGPSRNSSAGKAAIFDGERSIIEIPRGDELMNTTNFSLSFWVKTNSSAHIDAGGNPAGYMVMGLGAFYGFMFEISPDCNFCNLAARYDIAGGIGISNDLSFNGDGMTKDNGGWQGTEYCRNLTDASGLAALLQDKWAHVVCVFEASTKRGSIFINGEKMLVSNFNLWPDGDVRHNITGLKYEGEAPETFNELAFGFMQSRGGILLDNDPKYGYDFPTSNHFKGQLDDIRIFHKALTETEVGLMYNAEK
jgi:hypothetical protein